MIKAIRQKESVWGREHWCMDDHGFIGKCGIKTKAKLALHLKLVSEK